MLTFETAAVQGVTGIIEKLKVFKISTAITPKSNAHTPKQNLDFKKVVHRVSTLDAQPSNETGGILVLVTGALLVQQPSNIRSRTSWFFP